MFRQFGAGEIILILVVIMLLFGAKRMPDMARSLGRSMRILKSETKALRDDDDQPVTGTVIQEPAREIPSAQPQAAAPMSTPEPERSER